MSYSQSCRHGITRPYPHRTPHGGGQYLKPAAADPSPPPRAQQTLADQVEVLKVQLGGGGNMREVVLHAAAQLGIDSNGKTLSQLAALCMRELNVTA